MDILGTAGDDNLGGTVNGEAIYGLAGNDTIYGYEGSDTLIGGTGNDFLDGGAGPDTYRFSVGDGQDTIEAPLGGGTDTVVLNGALTIADVWFEQSGLNLIIHYGSAGDAITLNYLFYDDAYNIPEPTSPVTSLIVGGTSYALTGGLNLSTVATGGMIVGSKFGDTLNGGAGNDTLIGDPKDFWGDYGSPSGNDTLIGGAGNDYLTGGAGLDTYVFSIGDGQDTIEPISGETTDKIVLNGALTIADVWFEQFSTNLVIHYGSAGDSVSLTNLFYDDVYTGVSYTAASTLIVGGTSYDLTGSLNLSTVATGGWIIGSQFSDTLNGGAGNDTLYGDPKDYYGDYGSLSGNDTLIGGAGNDYLTGGAGQDTYTFSVGDGQDTVDAFSGGDTDKIVLNGALTIADVWFEQSSTNLIVHYGSGADSITLINFLYDDVFSGMNYSAVSTLIVGGTSYDLTGGLNLSTVATGGTIVGSQFSDTLKGNATNNTLYGDPKDYYGDYGAASGNDTLIGGAGDDTLIGGAGRDTYVFSIGDGQDAITAIYGGDTDTIVLNGALTIADVWFEQSNVNLIVHYGSAGDTISKSALFYDDIYTGGDYSAVSSLIVGGTSYALTGGLNLSTVATGGVIAGTQFGDTLNGGDGDDTLYGDPKDYWGDYGSASGNDTLIGGAGYDHMYGGGGNDSFNGGTGNDTSYGGTGNDYIDGASGDDSSVGEAGNDSLVGGDGADTLRGGAGNDTYFIDTLDDVSEESSPGTDDGGTDLVSTASNYTLGNFLENLRLEGAGNLTGTGNALNNQIQGNSGNNALNGLNGNDTLLGGAGNDTLTGGAGIDSLLGGAGDDTYSVDNTSDVVSETTSPGVDDGGTDLVNSTVSYTLSAFVENLTLTANNVNGTGNDLTNIIRGNSGMNYLTGLAGDDSLLSGAGADTVDGGNGNDYLDASDGNDRLIGGTGLDTLIGGTGVDTMYGGKDSDTYYVDNTADVVSEETTPGINDGGYDVVNSTAASYTLSNFVEDLTLTGTGNINGTGNALNNVIHGNNGNNVLIGMDGIDKLLSGGGADSLDGGNGDDYLDGGTGDDTLNGGAGNDSLLGFDGNDLIYGGTGNDTLNGQLGTDTMYGGIGNDVYYVLDTSDVVSEQSTPGTDDGGHDLIYLVAQSYTLPTFVEDLWIQGVGNYNATGNTMDNIIHGNNNDNILLGLDGNDTLAGGGGNDSQDGGNGNDYLDGSDGNDTLIGGIGNDTLIGSAGTDVLKGGAGDDTYYSTADSVSEEVSPGVDAGGTDIVYANSNYTLGNFVENLWLQDGGNYTGTGNNLVNVIHGNNSNNVLTGLDGNDSLLGGGGNDTSYGGNGNDYIDSSIGDDSLIGGAGNDSLIGGAGVDQFVFAAAGAANGTDRVFDFLHGTDQLVFLGADYGIAPNHVLTAAEFTTGTAATVASAQFIWNPTSHILYWDPDGTGAAAAIAITSFAGTQTLDATDLHFT